jgi:hypothetical protein
MGADCNTDHHLVAEVGERLWVNRDSRELISRGSISRNTSILQSSDAEKKWEYNETVRRVDCKGS